MLPANSLDHITLNSLSPFHLHTALLTFRAFSAGTLASFPSAYRPAHFPCLLGRYPCFLSRMNVLLHACGLAYSPRYTLGLALDANKGLHSVFYCSLILV
jgi:hypothetical protein